jgi:hypothetical protein
MSSVTTSPIRRGRPPRAGERSYRRVEFVLTEREYQILRQRAQQNLRPVAVCVREAVEEYVSDFAEGAVFLTLTGRQRS